MSVYFGSLSDSQHSLTCPALPLPLAAAAPFFPLSTAARFQLSLRYRLAFTFSFLLPVLPNLRYGACLRCILGGRYPFGRDR